MRRIGWGGRAVDVTSIRGRHSPAPELGGRWQMALRGINSVVYTSIAPSCCSSVVSPLPCSTLCEAHSTSERGLSLVRRPGPPAGGERESDSPGAVLRPQTRRRQHAYFRRALLRKRTEGRGPRSRCLYGPSLVSERGMLIRGDQHVVWSSRHAGVVARAGRCGPAPMSQPDVPDPLDPYSRRYAAACR